MKKLFLSTLLILYSSTLSLSQSDTTLGPMHSAVIDLCESLDIFAKMSEKFESGLDSLFTATKSKHPELNKRMMNIIEEESRKLVKEYISPNGDLVIAMVDVLSKYFILYEIRMLTLYIESDRTINNLNSTTVYKFKSISDSIKTDLNYEFSTKINKMVRELKSIVMKRFEDEGLLDYEDEWDIFEY
jgi:hypothetical protein